MKRNKLLFPLIGLAASSAIIPITTLSACSPVQSAPIITSSSVSSFAIETDKFKIGNQRVYLANVTVSVSGIPEDSLITVAPFVTKVNDSE
ncbi:MAG: hypothetical protein MJ223_02335 [Mycoplasmoidaceae bacterium]|nr:hypothetical protein [Mycoplasmoidaceae bacterium]